jgi:hypothetical protein
MFSLSLVYFGVLYGTWPRPATTTTTTTTTTTKTTKDWKGVFPPTMTTTEGYSNELFGGKEEEEEEEEEEGETLTPLWPWMSVKKRYGIGYEGRVQDELDLDLGTNIKGKEWGALAGDHFRDDEDGDGDGSITTGTTTSSVAPPSTPTIPSTPSAVAARKEKRHRKAKRLDIIKELAGSNRNCHFATPVSMYNLAATPPELEEDEEWEDKDREEDEVLLWQAIPSSVLQLKISKDSLVNVFLQQNMDVNTIAHWKKLVVSQCRVVSCHVMSCHVMSCHVMS